LLKDLEDPNATDFYQLQFQASVPAELYVFFPEEKQKLRKLGNDKLELKIYLKGAIDQFEKLKILLFSPIDVFFVYYCELDEAMFKEYASVLGLSNCSFLEFYQKIVTSL